MLWVKAFHVIAVVCWFAALFYLPRLFVYHAALENDDKGNERFKVMERKLFHGIMTPSAVATVTLGIIMLYQYAWSAYGKSGWLHLKLALVAGLLVYHFFCWRFLKMFAENRNTKSHVFFRVFNELPVFVLIGAILLVYLKPF